MAFRLLNQKKAFVQKLILVTSVVIMLFLPLSLTQSINLFASLKPISTGDRHNIPLAIPTEIRHKPDSHIRESQVSHTVDNEAITSQIKSDSFNEKISAVATCDKLVIPSVTAVGDDGNAPSNVIDNNLNTRWSNDGVGSWIQLDLGTKKSICSVDIAWYRGDTRQNNFVISVSDNGNTFTNKFTDTSTSSTTSPEKYNLPAGTEGRYVRITVNGNTENEWASITETAIFGSTSGSGGNVVGSPIHKWQTAPGSSTWSTFRELGGLIRADSDPVVAVNADGRLQLFVVGTGNGVVTKWQTSPGSSTWSAWTSLGGTVRANSDPVVAVNSDGRLQLFVVGTGNGVVTKWQTSPGSSTWSAWTSLGGTVRANSDPVVAVNSDGRLQLFVVGTGNGVVTKWQTAPGSSTWSAWTSLGGAVRANSDPVVAVNSDGRLQLFVVGTGNGVVTKWQTSPGSSTWSAWTSLGGTVRADSDPVVAVNSDGRLQLFVVGTGNGVVTKWQTAPGSSTWSAWTSLGGTVRANSDPVVVRNADGRLQLFVIGTGNGVVTKWQTSPGSSTWSAWTSLGGTVRADSDPVVAVSSDGRLEVFVTQRANQPPTADNKSVTTSINTPIDILLSGKDPEDDPITFAIIDQPAHGTLSSISSQNTVRYSPISGYTGPDSFTYIARDSSGATSINKATVNIAVSNTDAGNNDQFGIKKIYATKPGGEEWYMNMQDPSNDPQTSEPSMTKNADGSWRITSGQVRYGVFTSSGYQPDNVVKDHSVLASRGYMQSPNDWKNVEMTGQVKYNSGGDDEWTWYARGGRHTGSGAPTGCEGVALKGSLAYTGGQVRWAKEQWHVSYVFQPWENSPADGDGKFVGFKVAIYNMQLNGKTVVKMESWVDPNNNNQWQKVYDFIDQGGWGSQGGECNGEPDQIVTWGGPIASFRWDDGNSIDIKNLSVREIVPPT